MPYGRPMLTVLRAQAVQDLQSGAISGVDALLQKSVLRVLALVTAGFAYLHYDYQDYTAQQSVPWTATDEFAAGWGALKKVFRKNAAAAALPVSFTGVVGTLIPGKTSVSRSDGVLFTTNTDALIGADGTASPEVTAVLAGAAGNTDAGTLMFLTYGISGVNAQGTAGPASVTGADQETPGAFKSRYLQVYASPPQGGAANDYVAWALAVPGVTRAWDNPLGMGAGTVVVYTMFDQAQAANRGFPQGTNGVPAADPRDVAATGDQAVVANALFPLRPATALVYSVAPIPFPVAFSIKTQALVSAAARLGVLAAIQGVFLALADPLGGTLDTSPFEAAIAAVPGMPRFTLLAPTAEFSAPLGSLPVAGAVGYA